MDENKWKPETDTELAARLVTKRDERIKGLSAILEEKEAEVERLRSRVAELDELSDNRRHKIKQMAAVLGGLRQENADLRAALGNRDEEVRRVNQDWNAFVHNRENEELDFREWALHRIDWFRDVLTEEAAKAEYLYSALEAMQEVDGPDGELRWPRWEDLKSIKKEDCRTVAKRTVHELEKKRYEDEKARAALGNPSETPISSGMRRDDE